MKEKYVTWQILASRDRAETADAQQKSWDLRSSIWTSLKKERRGQHKGHLWFDFAFKKSPADLDYFHDIASALQIYIIYLIVFSILTKNWIGKSKTRNRFGFIPLNKKDSPFLDVPINWSNIARICSDADILVLMEKRPKTFQLSRPSLLSRFSDVFIWPISALSWLWLSSTLPHSQRSLSAQLSTLL